MRKLNRVSIWLLAGITAITFACGKDDPEPTRDPATQTPEQQRQSDAFASQPESSDPTATPATGTPEHPTPAPPTVAPTTTPRAATPVSTEPRDQVPAPNTPAGTAFVALEYLGKENGLNGAQADSYLPFLGFGESLFLRDIDDEPQPWIATGFDVAPDLSSVSITIGEGVEFQTTRGEFGSVTSEDVAWSMNQANIMTNPGSTHAQGAAFGHLWGEWVAVDDTTIRFDFENFAESWASEFLSQTGAMFTVFSKRAYDENGEAWAHDNAVATGPYEIEAWESDSSVDLVSRYASGGQHYLPDLTPQTNHVRFIQVPEAVTRVALLRVGEADAAITRPDDAEFMAGLGFTSTVSSSGEDLVFNPKKIASWEMGRTGESPVGDSWDLVLQPE